MSLGSTLRTARESHGITTSELAARTHMLVQIVEGLENEDFRRIPAPIYGRGFIKLYCEAVGLDPKPLQAEFMNLFNNTKDVLEKTYPMPQKQTVPKKPEPAAKPSDADVSAEPVNAETPDIEERSAVAEAEEPPKIELPLEPKSPDADFGELFAHTQPQPKRSYGALFEQAYAGEPERSKPSAAEKFRTTMSNVSSGVFSNVQKLPRNTGRIVTVSIFAIILFVLLGWGISILYKATTPSAASQSASAGTKKESDDKGLSATAQKATPGKKVSSKTTLPNVKSQNIKSSGIEIPALYID